MADLFVSYKAEDRARVAPLVAALKDDGVDLWWDAEIGGGDSWRAAIESELAAARCVLVVWSRRSTGPHGAFVRDEATRALRRGIYLPVRIDPVEPPLGFGETQALSLLRWKGDRTDPCYQAVLATARATIAGTARPVASAGRPGLDRRGIDRRVLIGGGIVLAAAAGIGTWRIRRGTGGDVVADSVAVLPFANLSGDPAQAYFSDGIAEELRNALTRIVRLKVAARTSSELMRNADAPTAAAKLGVANIVTGSVRRGAGTIRVNAELVDGTSGLTRWSDTYDRAAGDVLAIETGIAENVAAALDITLGGSERALLGTGGTRNAAAHDAYLRGSALAAEKREEAALSAFDAAVAADPCYALARAGRASVMAVLADETTSRSRPTLAAAEAEARRAIALAPKLGQPLAVLGFILLSRLDLPGATKVLTEALRLAPGDAFVLRRNAVFLAQIGRGDEAVTLIYRAQALDPLRANGYAAIGAVLFRAGRYDDAITALRRGLVRLPDDPEAQNDLALALLAKARPTEVAAAVANLPPDAWQRLTAEAIAAFKLGDRAASDRSFAALAQFGDDVHYQLAEVHAQRGEVPAAFAALDRAYAMNDAGLSELHSDPMLAPLHGDPRFAALERKIGFP